MTRLDEGGRYLGIPHNGGLAAPRTGSDDADAHNSGLLSVQETGCGTLNPFLKDKADAFVGGDEREYRPGFVESQSRNAGAYALSQRGDNVQPPVRLGPGWVLPSMTGVIAEATVTPNFQRLAKRRDTLPSGTFSDAVLGRHGDQADSFLG